MTQPVKNRPAPGAPTSIPQEESAVEIGLRRSQEEHDARQPHVAPPPAQPQK